MKIAVIANGEWDQDWGRRELNRSEFDLYICADGGTNHLISTGLLPNVVIGDLDSITEENLRKCRESNVEIQRYPKQKDQTDLELAMDYASKFLEENGQSDSTVFLYAGGGKRLDHLLGNISLMLGCAERGLKIILSDPTYDSWVMLSGREVIEGLADQQLSIIPLSESARVSSVGLFYELNNLTLFQNQTRGVSNVLKLSQASIEVHEGKILIVKLKQPG